MRVHDPDVCVYLVGLQKKYFKTWQVAPKEPSEKDPIINKEAESELEEVFYLFYNLPSIIIEVAIKFFKTHNNLSMGSFTDCLSYIATFWGL